MTNSEREESRTYPEDPLARNLQIAKEASIYANRIGHKSLSRFLLDKTRAELNRSKAFRPLVEQFDQLTERHESVVKNKLKLSESQDFSESPADQDSEEFDEWARAFFAGSIDASKRIGVTNCDSASMLAAEYCLNFKDIPAEIFFVKRKSGRDETLVDHVILVIGRDPKSNPSKVEEWGPSAVICDPWARTHYQATPENVAKNFQYITEKSKIKTLKNFDPKIDKLKLLFSIDTLRSDKQHKYKKTP